jgi:hypothetical protein
MSALHPIFEKILIELELQDKPTESSVLASAHRSVQGDGSAMTVDGPGTSPHATSGPDATSSQGKHKCKIVPFPRAQSAASQIVTSASQEAEGVATAGPEDLPR